MYLLCSALNLLSYFLSFIFCCLFTLSRYAYVCFALCSVSHTKFRNAYNGYLLTAFFSFDIVKACLGFCEQGENSNLSQSLQLLVLVSLLILPTFPVMSPQNSSTLLSQRAGNARAGEKESTLNVLKSGWLLIFGICIIQNSNILYLLSL